MSEWLDDETILDRFGEWLREAHAEADSSEDEVTTLVDPEVKFQEVGLFQIVEEFTAMRHEIKLQTRSARGLQEQAETLLEGLSRAIEQFRSVEQKEAQAAWVAGKGLAEALADIDVALDRGRAEIEKVTLRLIDDSVRVVDSVLDELLAGESWFQRFLLRSIDRRTRELARRRGEARRNLADALIEGYGLIQNRLRRALKSERIEAIECIGHAVDPERMTVVEVVDAPGLPPGQVVEEICRGYTWKGRLLRYAEVRAARSSAPVSTSTPMDDDPGPAPDI
jgi:molecular chaperone GrpE